MWFNLDKTHKIKYLWAFYPSIFEEFFFFWLRLLRNLFLSFFLSFLGLKTKLLNKQQKFFSFPKNWFSSWRWIHVLCNFILIPKRALSLKKISWAVFCWPKSYFMENRFMVLIITCHSSRSKLRERGSGLLRLYRRLR